MTGPPLLEVDGLRVEYPSKAGPTYPVDGVSFSIDRGEVVALVGESGCGKSLTSLALLRLVPNPGRVAPGSVVRLDGQDVGRLENEALRAIRGGRIGLVFQDPNTSLNPVLTIGYQVLEAVTAHRRLGKTEAKQRVLALLEEVGIPDPLARYRSYPHELSGGLKQRVMIAIALAGEPDLLIADEPTTALDVTIQAQILELLERLRATRRMAVLLITHDLGVVAGRAGRVLVMYAGRLVESGPTDRIFSDPAHPYTQALLRSIPRLTGPIDRLAPIAGVVPQSAAWPLGCRFHPRCPLAVPACSSETPPWRATAPGHEAQCWLVEGTR
ncbi:MAG: ABC transporter ATP-binding protein [Gemmatimonadetes bacterium]|nr:ABC transporter ATP-binding protein [Gemmatimonadota bacterium]